jgi:dTDP-4-amino-4,6-dideoxygalactose transaminase
LPADVIGIQAIVGPDIPIIEDAAQAMGEIWNGNKLGTLGDIGFYSLGRGKALSTMEGGIIITNREDLAERIKSLTVSMTGCNSAEILKCAIKTFLTTFLQNPWLFWFPKALPFLKLGETLWEPDFSLSPLSAFHIKLAKGWQKRLARHRRARKRNCTYWRMRLPKNLTQVGCTTDISMIRFPVLMQSREQRDFALIQSEQLGLGLMLAYPTPIHHIRQLANEFSDQKFPEAEDVCNRLLTIPVHEYVRPEDNERIHSILIECKKLF